MPTCFSPTLRNPILSCGTLWLEAIVKQKIPFLHFHCFVKWLEKENTLKWIGIALFLLSSRVRDLREFLKEKQQGAEEIMMIQEETSGLNKL